MSKYCDRTPFISKVEENISPEICVHCVLITENCPSVNWALSSLSSVYHFDFNMKWKKVPLLGRDRGRCFDIIYVFKPILSFVLPLSHSNNPFLKCTLHIAWEVWLLINVKTGSSHYNQLSVVTSYHGIIDYHSNKVVIIMKNFYGDLNFQQLRFHRKRPSSAIVALGGLTEFHKE